MNKHKNLGLYLKKSRESADLSQLFVAKKLGYSSAQFISNIERGLCSPPLTKLRKMVDLYKLDPEDVIEIMLSEQVNILNRVFFEKRKRA